MLNWFPAIPLKSKEIFKQPFQSQSYLTSICLIQGAASRDSFVWTFRDVEDFHCKNAGPQKITPNYITSMKRVR